MGCGSSTGRDLGNQTDAVVLRFHLHTTDVSSVYDWFSKIREKANRSRTPFELAMDKTIAIKVHDIRASLALPSSMLSDHLFDLVDMTDHSEATFPEFLELCALIALASKEQLISFGFHAFPVDGTDTLMLSDFVAGLTELKSLYPGVVHGNDIPVARIGLTAKTIADEQTPATVDAPGSQLSIPGSGTRTLRRADTGASEPLLTLSSFTQVMVNQPWFFGILQTIQETIHRKTRGPRSWRHQRDELVTREPSVLSVIDERVRRKMAGKKERTAQTSRHHRRISTMHNRAMSRIYRQSMIGSAGSGGGLLSAEQLAALKQEAREAASGSAMSESSEGEGSSNLSRHPSVSEQGGQPRSIMKKPGSARRANSHRRSVASVSPLPGHESHLSSDQVEGGQHPPSSQLHAADGDQPPPSERSSFSRKDSTTAISSARGSVTNNPRQRRPSMQGNHSHRKSSVHEVPSNERERGLHPRQPSTSHGVNAAHLPATVSASESEDELHSAPAPEPNADNVDSSRPLHPANIVAHRAITHRVSSHEIAPIREDEEATVRNNLVNDNPSNAESAPVSEGSAAINALAAAPAPAVSAPPAGRISRVGGERPSGMSVSVSGRGSVMRANSPPESPTTANSSHSTSSPPSPADPTLARNNDRRSKSFQPSSSSPVHQPPHIQKSPSLPLATRTSVVRAMHAANHSPSSLGREIENGSIAQIAQRRRTDSAASRDLLDEFPADSVSQRPLISADMIHHTRPSYSNLMPRASVSGFIPVAHSPMAACQQLGFAPASPMPGAASPLVSRPTSISVNHPGHVMYASPQHHQHPHPYHPQGRSQSQHTSPINGSRALPSGQSYSLAVPGGAYPPVYRHSITGGSIPMTMPMHPQVAFVNGYQQPQAI